MMSLRESRQGEEKRAQDRTRKNSKQDKKETEKQTNKEGIGRKEGGEYEGAQGKNPGGPNVAAPHEKLLSHPSTSSIQSVCLGSFQLESVLKTHCFLCH